MTTIQIIQMILALLPSGLQLTEDVLALIQSLEKAFSSGAVALPRQHAMVAAMAADLLNGAPVVPPVVPPTPLA